jgi:hypothetical protein
MGLWTAATQVYLQPSEGATGWGVFLPGDAPPQLATFFFVLCGVPAGVSRRSFASGSNGG